VKRVKLVGVLVGLVMGAGLILSYEMILMERALEKQGAEGPYRQREVCVCRNEAPRGGR
jgi:hypothetical protein